MPRVIAHSTKILPLTICYGILTCNYSTVALVKMKIKSLTYEQLVRNKHAHITALEGNDL